MMKTNRFLLTITCLACLVFGFVAAKVDGDEVPTEVRDFLKTNCYDCHEGSSAEAGFDIESLPTEFEKTDVEKWVRMFDRVHDKEMPPKDYGRLEKSEKEAFESALGKWLETNQKIEHEKLGRVRGRRLTNLQLERTLHDMLGIDIPLARMMPDEPRVNGFPTVANGQSMSHFQLEQHLAVVDAALDEAFRRALSPKKDEWKRDFTAKEIARRNPRRRCREAEMIGNEAVVWSAGLVFYGRIPATTADESGWYRMKVRAKALKPKIGDTVWCTVRTGKCISTAPLMGWAGAFEAKTEFDDYTFEAWLPEGHRFEIRPGDVRLKKGYTRGGQVGAGEIGPQDVAGVAMKSLTLERFHKGMTNDEIRTRLFGDLKIKLASDPDDTAVQVDDAKKEARKRIRSFAHRAFRRVVDPESLNHYFEIVNNSIDKGEAFHESLRAGYRAILCSPRFLYFYEAPGQLDDFAVASRLSYLLWNRMPDQELFKLALKKQLRSRSVLAAQVDRMLSHKHGKNFVQDLAHDWLDLRLIDFTEPDRKLYPGFDLIVENAMVEETHRYLQAMLEKDLSVKYLIDSNFSFLNSRLAQYYGIKDVTGDDFQRVKLKSNYHRGGLITHGSILKVTANGTTTSPVIRGVWMSERILGEEIPPPPDDISAIEPDIRGAKSIREQLAKHKNDPSCASCHVKMDPPGYALENYDPSGRWRDSYTKLKGKRRVDGIKVDASSRLPGGKSFRSIDEFQELLTKQPRKIATNVVEKLVTYGTGAPVEFADRALVEKATDLAKSNKYGFRTLIKAVVTSDLFLNK